MSTFFPQIDGGLWQELGGLLCTHLKSTLGNTLVGVGEGGSPMSPPWPLPPPTQQPPPRRLHRPASCHCIRHSCPAPERPTWRGKEGTIRQWQRPPARHTASPGLYYENNTVVSRLSLECPSVHLCELAGLNPSKRNYWLKGHMHF